MMIKKKSRLNLASCIIVLNSLQIRQLVNSGAVAATTLILMHCQWLMLILGPFLDRGNLLYQIKDLPLCFLLVKALQLLLLT